MQTYCMMKYITYKCRNDIRLLNFHNTTQLSRGSKLCKQFHLEIWTSPFITTLTKHVLVSKNLRSRAYKCLFNTPSSCIPPFANLSRYSCIKLGYCIHEFKTGVLSGVAPGAIEICGTKIRKGKVFS